MSILGPVEKLFAQTASVTVGNSSGEATLTGAGVGSLTIPANFLIPGTALRIAAFGYYTTTASPTLDMKIKLGATTVLDTGANNAPTAVGSARYWEMTCIITCRTVGAPGTVQAQGTMRYATSHTAEQADDFGPNTTTTNITTTGTLVIDFTAQWGTGNPTNTMTCTNLSVWAEQPV